MSSFRVLLGSLRALHGERLFLSLDIDVLRLVLEQVLEVLARRFVGVHLSDGGVHRLDLLLRVIVSELVHKAAQGRRQLGWIPIDLRRGPLSHYVLFFFRRLTGLVGLGNHALQSSRVS
uniref:Uncharacterized protein n=1 Tax=Strombidium inclinatum TaxID=197538 RepID=A0A7S3IN26_9SPIT